MSPTRPRSRFAGITPFVLWTGATVVVAILTPNPGGHGTHRQLGLPPCPSVLCFDRPCPGCGLTTSWTALLHGDFASSFRAHPLGPALYATFTGVAFLALTGVVRHRPILSLQATNRLVWIVVACLLTFGAYRFAVTPGYGDPVDRANRILSRF